MCVGEDAMESNSCLELHSFKTTLLGGVNILHNLFSVNIYLLMYLHAKHAGELGRLCCFLGNFLLQRNFVQALSGAERLVPFLRTFLFFSIMRRVSLVLMP